MKIHYYSYLIEENLYKTLYTKKEKPGMQAQVFNRLIVDGLIKNNLDVLCFSTIPTSKSLFDQIFPVIKNNKNFKYFKVINIPLVKDINIFFNAFFQTVFSLIKDKYVTCVCDVLCPTSAYAVSVACKLLKRQCIGIVTDIPELFETNKLFIKITNGTIKNCSDYIFLTEAMNEYLNKEKKPYQIIEGMCKETEIISNTKRENVFMYAGSIDKVNGIDLLVNAFKDIDTDYELHIYGDGDFEDELINITLKHSNIKYFGLTTHENILKTIQDVSFLVNPRGSNHIMVKYSFPSKNMEYLASGTPFLCTKLPCIPDDYFAYINFFDSDDLKGIKSGLERVLNTNYDLLLDKAKKAQHFVLENKNNQMQTKKIIKLIRGKQ